MNIQTLTLVSFNGHMLNDSTYEASIPIDAPPQAEAGVSIVNRAGNWPMYAGATLTGRTLPMRISRKDGQPIGSILNWFQVQRDAQYQLIAQNTEDDSYWYVMAKVQSTPKLRYSTLMVNFFLDDPIWRSVTPGSDTWNITATAQTKDVVVGGDEFSRPVFTVGPTSARTGGFGYQIFVALSNPNAYDYVDALNLVDGDWDTAALVTGGKMLSSGDDLRVFHDPSGLEVFRWFGGGGIDSTTTRLIVNVNLPPSIATPAAPLTLDGAMAGAGTITTIDVKDTETNRRALNALSQQPYKVIAIDLGSGTQEIFTYESVDVWGLQILGVTRAQKLSSMQAHADGATIQHVIGYWVMYGNSSATAPSTGDEFEPMYTLASFTNASRVLANFYDPDNPGRLGQFAPNEIMNIGGESEFFTANEYTFASPAEKLGMAIKAYLSGTAWRAPTANFAWIFAHPAGMTNVNIGSGKKYRYSLGWPAYAQLGKSLNGKTFVRVANESQPTAAATWETLTTVIGSLSLSGTYLQIALSFAGTVMGGIANNYAAIQFDDITFTLDSSNIPTIWFGAENNANYEEFRITNTTTSQWLEVRAAAPVGDAIIIDTENLEAYLASDPTQFIAVYLDDESRAEWLPWSPGVTNTLRYDEVGANALTIDIEWEDRNQ